MVLLFCASCFNKTEKIMNKYVIGFSQCTTGDEWRKTMNEEMLREIRLTRNYDIELIIKDANNNNQKQINDIKELIDQGIDLLIVSPNEAEPLTQIIGETYDNGIPVITIDRNINSNKFTAYIGADNFVIGKEAGSFATELLHKKGKIIEITGLNGSTPAIERTRGFMDVIKDYPEIQIIRNIEGDWLMEKSLHATDSLFSSFREFDLIYAHNDVMAYGAYLSAKKYGINPYIIGIDGLNYSKENSGVQYVLDGYLDGTFLYPTGGDKAIQLAIAIMNSEPFERYYKLNTIRIDNSNARITRLQGEQILDQQTKIDNLDGLVSEYSKLVRKKNTFLFLTTSIIILILLLAGLVFYIMLHKNRLNKELDAKHKIISKQNKTITEQRDDLIKMLKITEETKETKLQLLTNIYHEFRNVLTIVTPPVQELMNNHLDNTNKEKLAIVQKGANRLLRLSEEILNYTKNNTNKLKLVHSHVNLSEFIKNIVDVFQQKVGEKNINLILKIQQNVCLDCDATVIEKVVYNLLANALHYTNVGGKIIVSLIEDDLNVSITVRDNGVGISSLDLPHIFTRMYRVNNANTKLQDEGTGIGLAFSKELIQLHGGQISVKSNKHEFTEFNVLIPKMINHYDFEKDDFGKPIEIDANHDKNKLTKDNTILIIEDNPDILKLISNIVSKDFNVLTAYNGEKGLELAINRTPDIILSDILMPIMDGITMCIKLKKNPLTSHIPIILLTAVDSTDTNIKGLEVGADAYITKPFNETLLNSTIHNLIRKRDRFKDVFGFSKFIDSFSKTKDKEDHAFINRCVRTIYENIDNECFSIDNLAELMNTSRSSFYKKIKRITSLRVVDFMKESKLYYAAKLLLNKNLTINEIAWKSGFSDVKYFSKCFSKRYGSNPSVFRIKLNNESIASENELLPYEETEHKT